MPSGLKRIERKLRELDALFPCEVTINWTPQPGAQSLAFHSPADELFYGGQPGGGKTDLILGLALTQHNRSLILRRRALDLAAIKVRYTELTGQVPTENRINGRYIQFGGCKDEGSKYKYQGQPHDLKAFDEVNQFLQSQYEYIKTWNRTALSNQRCRVVCSFNPPTSPEQRWVIDYLAPWLNPKHPKPAQSGEIRYYIGKEEVDGPEPQQGITPMSRCFILSSTADNPLLMAAGYDRILANLPPELQALTDFASSMQDDPYQVIPTKWVELAQQRWRSYGERPETQDALAIDVARGGHDQTVLAARYRDYVKVWQFAGKETPDAQSVVQLLSLYRTDNSPISVDVVGVGASVFDLLRASGYSVSPVNGAERSYLRDRSGQFGFANKRAELYWKLRELLDPQYGATLALPPNPEVLRDLTAPRWKLTLQGILLESKDEIKKRIGCSPDVGDAIVMACNLGSLQYGSAF
jgi:hypothetical protein